MTSAKIRNAIIAHIDHGKTTLIDSIFQAARVFATTSASRRVMDATIWSGKGITIRSSTARWSGEAI